jgi:hypothetical protein
MREIPDAWKELYDLVTSHLDDAILAGGSLRDWDNGRAVKDLDFFYDEKYRHGLLTLVPQLRLAGYSIDEHRKLMAQADEDNSWDGTNTFSTLYFPSTDVSLPDINLISVADASIAVQLDRFDFGICRIGYDGVLHKTDEYLMDQEMRAFSLLADRDQEQRARSYERFGRIQERYRGWRLLDPWVLAREFAGAEEPVEPKMEPLDPPFEWSNVTVQVGSGGGGSMAAQGGGGGGNGGVVIIQW